MKKVETLTSSKSRGRATKASTCQYRCSVSNIPSERREVAARYAESIRLKTQAKKQ